MKLFCSLSMLIGLLFHSVTVLFAQSNQDTIHLSTIQVEGTKKSRNSNENKTEIDSLVLAKSIMIRLSELLAQNTPLFIKEYGRGAMATASFRGTAPSHTQVTWNGLELNSPMLGMVDFSQIPVYFTDEVKLLHGAASLSESSGSLGGTILLENKADWNNRLSGKLLSGFGSYRTFDEYFQLSKGNRKIQSKIAFFYNSSANDFPFINKLNATLDPISGNYLYLNDKNRNASYLNYGLLQELYVQAGANQTFSFRIWLQHNQRSIPQLLTNESDPTANVNQQGERSLRAVADWKLFGYKSKFSLKSSVNIQKSAYLLENKVNGAPNQVVIDASAKFLSFVNKLNHRIQLNPWMVLNSGLEVHLDKVISENNLQSAQISGYQVLKLRNTLFTELETKFGAHWNADILFRETMIEWKHESLAPLIRLSYHPNKDKPLFLNGSVSRNSHPPSLNDLYFIPGGNPMLKSESSTQFDIGSTNDISIGNSRIHTGISLFYSKIYNWIIWLPTFQGFWEPTNIDNVISQGLEANTGFNFLFKGVRCSFNGNYALTGTVNGTNTSPSYGKQLTYIPKNSANLNLHFNYSHYYFDWMWNYYSKRYTTTANSEETYSDYLYPYFMNNLQLGSSFSIGTIKYVLECKVLNIFNEAYRTVLQRPMPGRNYQIVLRYDF